ncbi:MAG TPA: enoyl-ACP reductase [Candidatus Wallbacteria bacterium]|nr:enoyl-ACP reductase [Candidatus Wallbacteria bacterium]
MSYLKLENRKFLVFGLANKRSVAYHISKTLEENGAITIHSVQNEKNAEAVMKLFPRAETHICDVESEGQIYDMASIIREKHGEIQGIVHSLAYANYSEGLKPFYETKKKDFLQAMDISCFSLIAIANAMRDIINKEGSVITISISSTNMAVENYGYMAPVKAALDSAVCFLAKSFSKFSNIRFNAVAASLLKTSASAGIPGYLDYYDFAEKFTLRKKNLMTEEVGTLGAFLLSPASSGINAQRIVIDAGMGVNFFDNEVIRLATLGAKNNNA